MIAARGASPEVRDYATRTMKGEIEALNVLVDDVRDAADERNEFEVHPRPLPVGALLQEAHAYAVLLPGGHPVTTALLGGLGAREKVWADPERVAQVLRNLLSNAAKYSPQARP